MKLKLQFDNPMISDMIEETIENLMKMVLWRSAVDET